MFICKLLRNKIPVLLNSKLLNFAFDALSRSLQDDALQKQEVILVKYLILFQRANDLWRKITFTMNLTLFDMNIPLYTVAQL